MALSPATIGSGAPRPVQAAVDLAQEGVVLLGKALAGLDRVRVGAEIAQRRLRQVEIARAQGDVLPFGDRDEDAKLLQRRAEAVTRQTETERRGQRRSCAGRER
mgnify:CR=1 FL=1